VRQNFDQGYSFLGSDYANRYHHWELDRVARVSESVTEERGERIEHNAPQLRYEVDELYVTFVQGRGRPVEVTCYRKIPQFLTVASSQIKDRIEQLQEPIWHFCHLLPGVAALCSWRQFLVVRYGRVVGRLPVP
jgi:hypothetical protein